MLSLWRRLFRKNYVVVYDHGDLDDPVEEYYGYFSSIKEARRMFLDMANFKYYNAKICLIVEDI